MSLSKKLLSNKPIQRDIGLLIIRIGIGLTVMTLHGYGKIKGGPGLWDNLGGAMSQFGITFAPKFWGFMAAFSEFGGSALLILG
ncbi:MAG: DoxX family membrane protein, partial [Candidatus Eisenbacteria bacterium]|nr:DoxX family membrane protein [Candidatus Eisenbacteria bacterium]